VQVNRHFIPTIGIVGAIIAIITAITTVYTQQKADGIAAIVNKDIILFSEVMMYAEQEAARGDINPATQPEIYKALVKNILDYLINLKVQMIKAEEDTLVKFTSEMINKEVEKRIQTEILQRGSKEAVEQYYGVALSEMRTIIAKQIRTQATLDELSRTIPKDVSVTRQEVEVFFKSHKDSLQKKPKTFVISHILLTPSSKASIIAEKKALMDSLLNLLRTGADFAELAQKYSDDTNSAQNGGDLGWLESGDLSLAEFDSAVAALDVGKISSVVRTPLGFHIIQLLERDKNRFHVRHLLKLMIPTDEDVQQTISTLNSLRERTLKGEDFGKLAAQYSEDPQAKQTKGQIGSEWELDQLEQAIPEFKVNVESLKVGEITQPFRTNFGYHIVRVDKISEERPYDLQKDYRDIEKLVLEMKKAEYYNKWVADARKSMYVEIKLFPPDSTTIKK
jgi:peptidyl-prolyl cis-trans isomerase SurA